MSDIKVIVHWLNYSRSQRVVWLLEELGIPYELKVYLRNKEFKAPKELENIHPLGKSPVIEIVNTTTGESKVIPETGHIFSYLLRHHDKSNILNPTDPDQYEEVDYFLHYTEGTLQPNLVALLVHGFAKVKAPFGTRFLMGMLVHGIDSQFYIPNTKKNLAMLDDIIKKQHDKGSKYFVGDKLTAADIILQFPICVNLFENTGAVSRMGAGDLNKEFPNLAKWAADISKEPKLIKANELVAKYETAKPNI
ncbi:Glutathione S-transferase 1 [Candida viswanathii]|jgi:glutathione S-transferase|uniref:glutathione transferase n=1 Tax=Candida viswanathii TaxID=5486 RepID=A0A367YEY2_9ASCO|nr:Glutathione S-transferase 1 [Candida viswanathii]